MRLRRARIVAVAGAIVAVGVTAAMGVTIVRDGDTPDRAGAAPVDQPNERFFASGPQFAVECGFSHAAAVDPIVWPGRTGRSHRHDFFGATTVDADSTGATLAGTPTTCRQRSDTAAYWAPSLLDGAVAIAPAGVTAYYRVAPGVDATDVVPYPLGLAAIAGNPGANGPQPTSVVGFGCGRGGPVSSGIPACPAGQPLQLRVTFPDCWDGEHLDRDDHRSHLAYSGSDGCDDRHPVAVPRLTLVVRYPVDGDPTGLTLASGAPHTAHADFLNGWDETALHREVAACLHREVVCAIPDSARSAG